MTPATLHIRPPARHLAYDHQHGGDCQLVSLEGSDATLTRAVECYNACQGIPDPAAAIQAAREALQKCDHGYLCRFNSGKQCDCGLDKALELLTPKP